LVNHRPARGIWVGVNNSQSQAGTWHVGIQGVYIYPRDGFKS